MLSLPSLSSSLSPQLDVQLMETSGASKRVRLRRANIPATVSTIVVTSDITRLS